LSARLADDLPQIERLTHPLTRVVLTRKTRNSQKLNSKLVTRNS
jgi:hypothetical protein